MRKKEKTMSTCIAFVGGLLIGGIVTFFVTAVLIVEERSEKQGLYQLGYNRGYQDGLEKKGE